MRENLPVLFGILFWCIVIFQHVIQHKRIHEKVDGVETETVSEKEGILTFGGISYSLNLRGSGSDMNIGAAYRVKCEQNGIDVLMKNSFEKRDFKWWSLSTEQPGLVLNQAYHRFFKEVFNVQVVR